MVLIMKCKKLKCDYHNLFSRTCFYHIERGSGYYTNLYYDVRNINQHFDYLNIQFFDFLQHNKIPVTYNIYYK